MSEDILTIPAPKADVRLVYGPDQQQFAELRVPADGADPHPVAIVIHGGFWRSRFDLAHIGHLCAALTASGIATWNVEYRRVGNPGGGWPETFLDVAAAADHLREIASEYDLDLRRVVTVGHSAGGQLALWLAGRCRLARGSELYSPDPIGLHAAISLAGVSDLVSAWQVGLGNNAVETFMGAAPEEAPERYRMTSPAALLPIGIPQLLVHGTEDTNVPFELSELYTSEAHRLGDTARLLRLPGADHFAVIDPRSKEWPSILASILGLVDGTNTAR